METYKERFAVFYIAVSNALKTLPERDKEILAREAKEFLPFANGDIKKLAIIIASPKNQTSREALTAFQEVLWDTLLAAGKESLAKLDIALRAYEKTIDETGETIPAETLAYDLLSTIGETIDEASAW